MRIEELGVVFEAVKKEEFFVVSVNENQYYLDRDQAKQLIKELEEFLRENPDEV